MSTAVQPICPQVLPRSQRVALASRCAVARRVVVLAVHHEDSIGPRLLGGAEKYLLNTIDALLEAGASVQVAFSGANIYLPLLSHWGPFRLRVENVNWIDAELHGDDVDDPATITARMDWLASTQAATVFVVQQASGAAFRASIIAARFLGLRVVQSIRQPPSPLAGAGLLGSLAPWRRRAMARVRTAAGACDAIIFNSQRVRDEYVHMYRLPARRCRVIHNGECVRPQPPVASNGRRLAVVGRLTHAKGADLALDAFKQIAGRYPDATLTYFGDGPLRADLAARASDAGLSTRVNLVGYESNRDRMYASMDVCVLASRRESMSNATLEAMAWGIACITTDVGGQSELVDAGTTGWVTPPDDVVALAVAMDEALADPRQAAERGEAARRQVAANFERNRQRRLTVACVLGLPDSIV
ncbi:Alpha-D-kanosaminyltransferase [Phycisphaerae bacterium RAS2]|nr:Alpha-D-kanosaminyltransferase [Phycisphaerae bacterium RAS2]